MSQRHLFLLTSTTPVQTLIFCLQGNCCSLSTGLLLQSCSTTIYSSHESPGGFLKSQWLLIETILPPKRRLERSRHIFGYYNSEKYMPLGRDQGCCPVQHPTTKNYLAKNVNNAKLEKCSKSHSLTSSCTWSNSLYCFTKY